MFYENDVIIFIKAPQRKNSWKLMLQKDYIKWRIEWKQDLMFVILRIRTKTLVDGKIDWSVEMLKRSIYGFYIDLYIKTVPLSYLTWWLVCAMTSNPICHIKITQTVINYLRFCKYFLKANKVLKVFKV